MRTATALSIVLLSELVGHSAGAQTDPPASSTRSIATIDFYGQGAIASEVLRRALPFSEGDAVSPGDAGRLKAQATGALSRRLDLEVSGVKLVCCASNGGVHLFVGVRPEGRSPLQFLPAPDGDLRLPDELVAHSRAVDAAVMKAVLKGRTAEDDSKGHALLTQDADARRLQEASVSLAAQHLVLLRRVLCESADGSQRAMAARLLAYAPHKETVVPDLVRAIRDPDAEVRNDALRALVVFRNADLPVRIPFEPIIDLLRSPEWTDLNKASTALASMSATPDPGLLPTLCNRSRSDLEAMARWHDREHSYPAFVLLGRIGGLSDQQIFESWNRADADSVIEAAHDCT